MKKGFYRIMAAQFFSSLADNALFIAALQLITELSGPSWLGPMTKWSFALTYVLLAAFVGAIADSFPKGKVMFATNTVKILGCILMYCYAYVGIPTNFQVYLVCVAYGVVGIGAAAYSPAKYGIITELLPPEQLVKGNGWIEGLTVISIILGFVLGGTLINPSISSHLLQLTPTFLGSFSPKSPAEIAIFVIAFVYLIATLFNLSIPRTGINYPKQESNPFKLVFVFSGYVKTLWTDKLGQISLAVTTLFWGAGATLQLLIIDWGREQLGYRVDQSSILMGVTAFGTIIGAILASKFIPLKKTLKVLPVGIVMGLSILLLPITYDIEVVYALLIVTGALSGFFVVPMNALLQHRGHVLLSAGHSIAVQNFNEQLNILLMVASYSLMMYLSVPINTIIIIFGLLVSSAMMLFMYWNHLNHQRDPSLNNEIGSLERGREISH